MHVPSQSTAANGEAFTESVVEHMKFLAGLPCYAYNFSHTETEAREIIMKIHHEQEDELYYWDEKKEK